MKWSGWEEVDVDVDVDVDASAGLLLKEQGVSSVRFEEAKALCSSLVCRKSINRK